VAIRALKGLQPFKQTPVSSTTPELIEIDDAVAFRGDVSTRALVKQGVAAILVSTLGLVAAGSIAIASAASSDKVDQASATTDTTSADLTRAQPRPEALVLDKKVQATIDAERKLQSQEAGGLTAFSSDSDSVTRSAVRSVLTEAVAAESAKERETDLVTDTTTALEVSTTESAADREAELAKDVATAKKEARRIASEKAAAEKLLKAQLAKSGSSVSASELASIVTSGGGTTPIAPGHYHLGAHWGQYGMWSRWHTGQDFPAAIGTPIRAVAAGVVGSPVGGGWAGNNVVIHHANGGSTLSAHMSRTTVRAGQVVKAGDVIGYVGMSGRTFGPHLHFEYYPAGTTPGDIYSTGNPIAFLASLGVRP